MITLLIWDQFKIYSNKQHVSSPESINPVLATFKNAPG